MKPLFSIASIVPIAGMTALAQAVVITLAPAPAKALTAFQVRTDHAFDESYSGVVGQFDFSFRNVAPNQYVLDLTVTNASPAEVTAASLTAFGFDAPSSVITSSFGTFLFDGTGTNFRKADDLSMSPAPDFDICIGTSNNRNVRCQSGSVAQGLAIGQSADVAFLFNTDSTVSTVDDVTEDFMELFNSVTFSDPTRAVASSVVLAARFQGINSTYNNQNIVGGSDKVTGKVVEPKRDSVPGPAGLLGAATAFGWARRMRRRIGA